MFPAAPPAPCYVSRRGRRAFYKTRGDATHALFGYPRAAAEIKRCRTREEALAYACEEDWIQAPPPKRARLETAPCTIACYGTATLDYRVGGIGIFFGPGDARNLSARVKGTGCGQSEHSEFVDREWSELCAVYVALKRAPAEGCVTIATPSRYAIAEAETWVIGGTKCSTFDTLVEAIAHLLRDAGRRVKLVHTPGLEDNEAVKLAHATLATDILQVTLPRLPLPEDRHLPMHSWGIRE